MTKLKLLLREIQDFYVRSNFDSLQRYLATESKLEGFQFVDIDLDEAVTDHTYPHGLRAVPLDVLVFHQTPGVTVTWNYDDFDEKNLKFTTSGACRIRAFVGRYTP